MITKTHDPKCYELARYFLQDEPELQKNPESARDLARCIQEVIEAWFSQWEVK